MSVWMDIAYDEAVKGMQANHGGPFGAVIVKNGKLIAKAHNRVLVDSDPTAHAEIGAIREAAKQLNAFHLEDCVLYTTCEPCPMCLGAVFWARIPTVWYGATSEDAAKGGFDDARFYAMLSGENRDVVLKQIEHEKHARLFSMWNDKSDAVVY